MSMSDRDKKLMLLIIPVLIAAAYWFLLLSPKRDEAATAEAAQTQAEDRLAMAEAASQAGEQAEQNFEVSYASVVRLGKAIPSSVDMPSLLVQLDSAAAGTGIHFTRISTGERAPSVAAPVAPAAPPAEGDGSTPAADAGGEAAQTDQGAAVESANEAQATADAQADAAESSGVDPADTQTSTSTGEGGLAVGGGSVPVGDPAAATAPAGLETVPLEMEFVGSFFNLADFFHRVKRFVRVANEDVLVSGRLLTVEGVSWESNSDLFPRLRATMTATIYLSPQAEGVTAGATPAGPSETTPAGDTTTPAESAPATTAAPTAAATN
jgi:Tfp pilus assembly protein PilO